MNKHFSLPRQHKKRLVIVEALMTVREPPLAVCNWLLSNISVKWPMETTLPPCAQLAEYFTLVLSSTGLAVASETRSIGFVSPRAPTSTTADNHHIASQQQHRWPSRPQRRGRGSLGPSQQYHNLRRQHEHRTSPPPKPRLRDHIQTCLQDHPAEIEIQACIAEGGTYE